MKKLYLALLIACTLSVSVSSYAAEIVPRIIGGTDAQNGAWPYMVSIHFPDTTGGHGCGGTLVAPNWVLTAAHCVDDEQVNGIFVYTGIYRQSETYLSTPAPTPIPIKQFIQHPQYDRQTFVNDIALLELSRNAPQDTAVLNAGGTLPGSSFALGWGLTSVDGMNSDALQYLQMPLTSNSSCSAVYEGMGLGAILSSQICAGYFEGGKDTCQNDSGGPLFVNTAYGVQQVGIVSYGASPEGVSCAGANSYGVYTRVSSFLDFIRTYVPDTQLATTSGPAASLTSSLELHIPSILWASGTQPPLSAKLSYIPGTYYSFIVDDYDFISAPSSYSAALSSGLELYLPEIIFTNGSRLWARLDHDPGDKRGIVFKLTSFDVY
jgi:secreted trypsin-like serine protease